MNSVKITVRDGVAFVDACPSGVTVEVCDHDTAGEPSRYTVTAEDLARWQRSRA